MNTIKFVPGSSTFLVRKLLKNEISENYPQFSFQSRELDQKGQPIELAVIEIVGAHKEYNEEDEYSVGDVCLAELSNAPLVEIGKKEFYVIYEIVILGKIEEEE